jgi:WD40 repeat protein/predicted ATPase/transcriptional regulator with XRE-family HTH domain/Tfp pilus assembly protein PilF
MHTAPGIGTLRDQLLLLRGRSGLTQRALAALLGVSRHALQKWEAGEGYPSAPNLQALIALHVRRGVLTAGGEAEEARALWAALRREAGPRTPPFDDAWFATLRPAAAVPAPAPPVPAGVPAAGPPPDRWQAWGEAPDVAAFQGRAVEREVLGRWLGPERCRLVAVLGLGGIGKTALATHSARELAPQFAGLCWRSLRNAPAPEDWLGAAIGVLAPAPPALPPDLPGRLGLLLAVLRERRCLLVLDNLETVLEPGASPARYRVGYEGYGLLLQRLGETSHQSCAVVTSREEPPELGPLQGAGAHVRVLRLGGLGPEDSRALLQDKGLDGDDAAWQALIEHYGGNPLALKVVGQFIAEVMGGSVAAFQEYVTATSSTVFGSIRRLLDEQVDRLSTLERTLLSWMAIECEPVGVAVLATDLGPGVPRGDVVEAVEALRRRSLLEQSTGGTFTLQQAVLEHTTTRLVARVCEEVLTGEPALLVRQPLLKAQATDDVRRSQERLLCTPLLELLTTRCGDAATLEQLLLALLEAWRRRPAGEQGYGPGNIVNLLRLLRGDLRGLDLSRLAIRHAYLQGVAAQDASMAGTHLAEAVLNEAFTYPTSVALSGDGAVLIAGTSTGEVCLWRAADRTLLLIMQGHTGLVQGVALSGDGHLVASASYDGTVNLWEAPSGQLLATLQGHTGGVLDVALSGDGHLVASAGYDGTVRLWEAESGRSLATLQGHTGGVRGVALSGDGHLVASAGFDGTVRLWEAASGRLRATLEGHTGGVQGVALSRDGRLVASASYDETVKLWEAPSGRLRATLCGHTSGIRGVALSGDGQLVASASFDGTVKLWEAAPASGPLGRLLVTLQGHSSGVRDVALSRDGRLVASASFDGTLKLWEVPSGRLRATLAGQTSGVRAVALSGDGQLVASASYDGTAKLWEAVSGRLLATLAGHTGGVPGVALSRDGRVVASASEDGTLKLWEAAPRGTNGYPLAGDVDARPGRPGSPGRLLVTLRGHASGVYGVALSGDGQLVVSTSDDGTVRLWEATSGRLLATLEGHGSGVRGAAVSGDGRLVASGGYDGTVKLWEAPSGRLRATLAGHASAVMCVALSGDGQLVASGSFDGTLKLWEAATRRLLATLAGHTGGVLGVALSRDGRLLASGGYDRTVRLWEAAGGQLLSTLEGHTDGVWGVALSGDGQLVASGSDDGTVRLWEACSGACLHTLRADRRYERLDITGLIGVTDAQRAALLALGARDGQPEPATTSAPVQVSSPPATAAALVAAPPPQPGPLPLAPDPDRPPTNLPAARTTFVGRATDLAALTQALDPSARSGPRLLTLSGVAGSGKTRLALQVAEALRDAYQDGAWLVELSPLPAGAGAELTAVAAATLAALELHEQPGQELLDTLLGSLQSRRLLLVLDNCEHVVDACAALVPRVLGTCPELRILVTSQLTLGLADETSWQVAPLVVPPLPGNALTADEVEVLGHSEAVQLFVARAQAVQPGFVLSAQNVAAVVTICRELDGLPLAIELAAARLNVLLVDDLLARLADRFRLLRRGGRSATDRHQALQATLDWSYALLDLAGQALLRRLAVFTGGWDVSAAEAVCAGDEVEVAAVLALLDVLLDRSLVYLHEVDGVPRYGMLETVRQYGLQQLERAGEAMALRERHLRWCMALAEQAVPSLQGPGQDTWLARLEREHDNLRAALRWSLDAGDSGSTALRLAGSLVRFWIMHAHFSEGRHWLGRALAAEAGTAAERARALGGAGLLAEGQSAYEEATRLLEESLGLWRVLGDQAGAARALANQGLVAGWQGDLGQARVLLEEALAIFRALDAKEDIAQTLTTLGLFVEFQGDAGLAWALLEEALSVFRAVGDSSGVAHALGWMALTARRHGEYTRALTLYEEALARARAVGDRRDIARWLNGLALSLASQGEYSRAQALLEESLALSRAQGDLRNTASSFNDLGEIARKQGAYGQARGLFEESQALQRQLGDRWGVANTHRNLADVAEKEGDTERTARHLAWSLEGFQAVEDRWGIAYCLEIGGRMAAACGRRAAAARLLAGAVALRETIGTQLEPEEQAAHDQLVRTIETALGEERFAALWERGRSLPLDDLVAPLALAGGAEAAEAGEGTSRLAKAHPPSATSGPTSGQSLA